MHHASESQMRQALRQPCALYRFFDYDGDLLYVGITKSPKNRLRAHARKPWWPAVGRIELEWFCNRWEAADAEAVAIWQEHPVHNRSNPIVEENRPRAGSRSSETLHVADAIAAFLR